MEWKQKRATTFCPILHPIPPNHLHHYNPPCVYLYLHLTPAPHPVTLSEPIKINSCRKTARSINIIKYPHAFEKKTARGILTDWDQSTSTKAGQAGCLKILHCIIIFASFCCHKCIKCVKRDCNCFGKGYFAGHIVKVIHWMYDFFLYHIDFTLMDFLFVCFV